LKVSLEQITKNNHTQFPTSLKSKKVFQISKAYILRRVSLLEDEMNKGTALGRHMRKWCASCR